MHPAHLEEVHHLPLFILVLGRVGICQGHNLGEIRRVGHRTRKNDGVVACRHLDVFLVREHLVDLFLEAAHVRHDLDVQHGR